MTRTGRSIAALVALGLAAAPFAASAQTSGTGAKSSTRPGVPAQQGTYGSPGQTVGMVTAPSIGTSNQPSVGVTNSVPTWKNTNPPAK
ncbi:hypothetical protein ACFQZO_20715 [Bradyrhizobium sp. GCM10027634]|uniref:hypothetical protein n=1 Tax=unclassified Bradyrhizobium TaxID=2631580 RepID=UPI0018C085F6|nr:MULTISPECIES: hypothetical protein [unclassified Bradyrhizobium]MDN5003262.1 hypothetical protein [Bradyrhizobium sp. WYCCWR 12677]QOZ48155.1 hypothetical protein XH89_35250 [Bradyrhizobium sp. CCBAU 53340]